MSAPTFATSRHREDARHTDGRFGEQIRGETELDLTDIAAAAPEPAPEHVTIVNPVFSEAEKGQRVKDMLGRLEQGVADVQISPKEWVDYLKFSSRFHRYSGSNRMLMYIQAPHATHVAGGSTWKNAGGSIRKGAKAIWILAPNTIWKERLDQAGNPVKGPDGKPVKEKVMVGFRDVPVFDISDIEGVEAPRHPGAATLLEGEAPDGMVDAVTGVLEDKGFTVRFDSVHGSANGYTNFQDMEVVVDSSLSPRQQAKTLAHEMGHVLCGHGDQLEHYHQGNDGLRGQMELEAESVSYMVSSEFGIADAGDYTFRYMHGWSNADAKKSREVADKVAGVTKEVLGKIAPRWAPTPIPELVEASEERTKARIAARRKTASASAAAKKKRATVTKK